MTLVDLLNIANEGYPDNTLSETCYEPATGDMRTDAEQCGDTLALFIVRELRSTFNPTTASDVQLRAAIHAVEIARDDLDAVLSALAKALDDI